MLVVGHGVEQVHDMGATVGALAEGEFTAPGVTGVLGELPVELITAGVIVLFSHLDFPQRFILQ